MVHRLWFRTRNDHLIIQIASAIKARQADSPLPESELVQCVWQGLMSSVDWSARPDQIEGLALREVTVRVSYPLELETNLSRL